MQQRFGYRLLFNITSISINAFLSSVNQSIDTGVKQNKDDDRWATIRCRPELQHCFGNGVLPSASSKARRDGNHLVGDPGLREDIPRRSIYSVMKYPSNSLADVYTRPYEDVSKPHVYKAVCRRTLLFKKMTAVENIFGRFLRIAFYNRSSVEH